MKTPTRPAYSWLIYAAAGGFVMGMVVMAALFTIFPMGPLTLAGPPTEAASRRASPVESVRPSAKEVPAAVSPPAQTVAPSRPSRRIRFKCFGIAGSNSPCKAHRREDLRDTFDEQRGSERRHEAIDMLAPRHTPVVAVEDGTIARLFLSDAGGITVYQFDPTSTFCYYYAHLQAYADGLKEGDRVKRGDVIGYVGTTGNAPKDTPHLHFAIFQLTDKKQWWQGTPIDPYKVLR